MRIAPPLLTALALLALASCSSVPSSSDRVIVDGPQLGQFTAGVGAVFERRCGSLDCHGQTGRPLRIYSANGLRLPNDAGFIPGGGPTTSEEQDQNYRSIITIEPEKLTAVVQQAPNGDPFSLLILRKPLNVEAHKGGPVIIKDDPSSVCFAAWIGLGTLDPTNCATGALLP